MPNCPKCDRPMATVLKREGGQVRTYYECPACQAEENKQKELAEKEKDGKPCMATPPPSDHRRQGHRSNREVHSD
jgi:hypothetical protein